jgi:hypothetical protein
MVMEVELTDVVRQSKECGIAGQCNPAQRGSIRLNQTTAFPQLKIKRADVISYHSDELIEALFFVWLSMPST